MTIAVPGSTEVRSIGTRANNAELMLDCQTLGYLDGSVLDMTYGTGRFWKTCTPDFLISNDLDPNTDADHHCDFRCLPFPARSFDTVVLDPPYKLNGTSTGKGPSASDESYGVGGPYRAANDVLQLIMDGLDEAKRLTRRYVLLKCQDQVVSGRVVWQTHIFTDHAADIGLRLVDKLHVQGYRQQPVGRRQVHARRDYSTLLVFEVA